jgi:zinc protease
VNGPIVLPELCEERLENGVTVVVARKKGIPLVALRLVVGAGSARDPGGRFGLANLVAQTVRRGTRRRTGARIDEEIESMGAELGAGADEDASYFGLSAPVESLSRLLEVLLDVAVNPTFPPAEIARIRRREEAALMHDLDEPSAVADRAMVMAAYGSHPYGHPVEGRRSHLRAMTRTDAVAFHRRWYAPASCTLVVIGAIQPAEVLALIRARLGRWSSTEPPGAPLPPPRQPERSVLVVDRPDLTQSQVRIALPALSRASPEYFPAVVANTILGGGFTSRLMEAIRVNRGLSYGVRSRFAMNRAGGLFLVSTFTRVETTAEITRVALDEIARFCDQGPTPQELERAANYLCGLMPLSLETSEQLADRVCDMKLYGFPIEEVSGYRERVRSVTAEQCREVARRHFPNERGAMVFVGPAGKMTGSLEQFGPVSVVATGRIL